MSIKKAGDSLGKIGKKIPNPIKEEVKPEIPKAAFIETDGQFILMNQVSFEKWLFEHEVKRTIKYIQNHHTWKPRYENFDNNHFDKLKGMKASHLRRKPPFSDIAQNITTFPDGLIAVCRPFKTKPAGIKGKNTASLCIEHLGNFDGGGDVMTLDHSETIVWLNAILCKRFDLVPSTDSILYHHWHASKSCPGSNFFGGNSMENAEASFIPLIKSKL